MSNFEPNPEKGQHFMIDKKLLQRIVKAAKLSTEDIVLEIGAGSGNLTRELIDAGVARIICTEPDTKYRVRHTKVKWIAKPIQEVLGDLEYTKIVANIPYHISEPLFKQLLTKPQTISVFVTGLQFARTLTQQSIIGLIVRQQYFVELLEEIQPFAFHPRPKTKSCLIRLTPRDHIPDQFLDDYLHFQKSKVKNYLLKITPHTKRETRELIAPLAEVLEKKLYELTTKEFTQIHNFIKTKLLNTK